MVAGVKLSEARNVLRCAMETAALARKMPAGKYRNGFLAEARQAAEVYANVTRRY